MVDMKETKPEVESEAKPTSQEVTEEDLEDWLDSMISWSQRSWLTLLWIKSAHAALLTLT